MEKAEFRRLVEEKAERQIDRLKRVAGRLSTDDEKEAKKSEYVNTIMRAVLADEAAREAFNKATPEQRDDFVNEVREIIDGIIFPESMIHTVIDALADEDHSLLDYSSLIEYEYIVPPDELINEIPSNFVDTIKAYLRIHKLMGLVTESTSPEELASIKKVIEKEKRLIENFNLNELKIELKLEEFEEKAIQTIETFILKIENRIEVFLAFGKVEKVSKDSETAVPSSSSGEIGSVPPEGLKREELNRNYDDILLFLFEKYISLVMSTRRDLALTNVNVGGMDDRTKKAYTDFMNYRRALKDLISTLSSGSPSEKAYKEDKELRLSRAEDLIENIAASWEYQFDCMKSGFGLAHNVNTIEIKVNPERWRRIFLDEGQNSEKPGYGLVESDDSSIEVRRIPTKETHRTVKGVFWDMWDMAIQISARPEDSKDRKFAYGDDLANRMDAFYDYVLEKFFSTPEGIEFKEYFERNHGNTEGKNEDGVRWRLVLTQIKQMFDIGNLLDDIYAAKAIHGSSLAHTPTMVSVNGESKALWSVVYPIASAGYTVENTQALVSHTCMNLAMVDEDVLKQEYEVVKGPGAHIPSGSEELIHHTKMYVDIAFDQELLLGNFDRPKGFPNFARSVLEFGLSKPDRYFSVELAGWDYIWTELFKPMGQLSEHQAVENIGKWAKQGLGKAKLVSQALSLDNFVDLSRLYYSRVFAAFEGNTEISTGRQFLTQVVSTGGLVGNVSDEVQNLRYELVESLQNRSSTVNYLGVESGGVRIKRELMNLLGANFRMSARRYSELTSELDSLGNSAAERNRAKEIKNILEKGERADGTREPSALDTVQPGRINPIAPKLLVNTFRRDEINRYVLELSEHHSYPGLKTKVDRFKKKTKGVWTGRGLVDEVHPPYLIIDHEGEK